MWVNVVKLHNIAENLVCGEELSQSFPTYIAQPLVLQWDWVTHDATYELFWLRPKHGPQFSGLKQAYQNSKCTHVSRSTRSVCPLKDGRMHNEVIQSWGTVSDDLGIRCSYFSTNQLSEGNMCKRLSSGARSCFPWLLQVMLHSKTCPILVAAWEKCSKHLHLREEKYEYIPYLHEIASS